MRLEKVLTIVFVLILALVFIEHCAFGHDATHRAPEDADPAMSEWFRSLAIPSKDEDTGEYPGSCCNEKDCFTLDQDAIKIEDNEYWVKDPTDTGHPAWLEVEPYRILKRHDNPTGRAVACVFEHHVLCFVRPGGV